MIFALIKLLQKKSRLTMGLPFRLWPNNQIHSVEQLSLDIYNNIIGGGGIGTQHSDNPDLYEFEYHNKLEKTDVNWLQKLFKYKLAIDFSVKNIPGEMFEVYFNPRENSNYTVNGIFEIFRNEGDTDKMLKEYTKGIVNDKQKFLSLRDRFSAHCAQLLGNPRDLNLIEKNFFSYLYYLTASDVIICKSFNLDDEDGSTQEIFHPFFNPKAKNIYYAFTKSDTYVQEPQTNYISHQIRTLEDYWSFSESLMKKIYSNDPCIQAGLRSEITRAIANGIETFVFDPETRKEGLKHGFFICTSYRNEEGRGFLPFKTREQNDEPGVWNERSYMPSVYPLGVLELLMTLLHRNGYDYKKLNLDMDKETLLNAYID
ncbi:MAG: hypothetical protein JNK27_11795 [Chitinophagaceae bacterium]|nr:hypothetical protein [Chitinophagaceae bacterium]